MGVLLMHWTKERVADAANRARTRGLFQLNTPGAYQAAWRNGWLDEVCAHKRLVRLPGFTKDQVFAEAKRYGGLDLFRRYSPRHYQTAERKGWLDDLKYSAPTPISAEEFCSQFDY